MEPLISIQLFDHLPSYTPNGVLRCDYQLDAVAREDLVAIEASVLWYTEGKGDEDMGVHFFERRLPGDVENNDLRPLRNISIDLPYTPLSYCGTIIQIHWCVRVRAFLARGKEATLDHPFVLGYRD